MYEEKLSEYEKSKEDLEINLSQNIYSFKMKEDEVDTLIMVLESVLVNVNLTFRVKREISIVTILINCPLRLKEVLRKLLQNSKFLDKIKKINLYI
jgi:hypothetical protein